MGEIFNTEIRWKRFSISLRDHFLLTAPALEKSEKKCKRIRSAEEKKMSTNQEEPRRTFRMTHPPKLWLVHNNIYFAAIILPTTFFKRFSALVIIWVLYKRMVPTIYVDSNPLLHILSHSSQYTYFLWSGPHSFTFLGGYDLSFLSLCRNKLIIHSYALARPIDQCNGTVRGLPRSDCNSNTQTQLDDQRIHLNNSLHAVRLIFLRQKGTANHEGHRME